MMNVEGQTRAIAQLQRAMRSGRLAHTWIFAGPFGVGKFSLAVELAKGAMCDSPRISANGTRVPQLPADAPLRLACESCESCRAVEARTHPDLHLINKELIRFHDKYGKSKGTTLSIDVIRGEITGDTEAGKEAKIYKRSFRGRGKWFIIDEADLMEVPAQNSLLKTLEEPPAESYMVLITNSPQDLLSTIRSRSQIVLFNALPEEVILPRLLAAGLGEADARLMARLGQGSLGRALRWTGDMAKISEKNTAAAERKAKRAEKGGDEDDEATAFTPGGILAWTRGLATTLDGLVAGRKHGSDLAAVLSAAAAEYAALQLIRDPLTSKDQATRDGLGILLGVAATWFDDRLRQGLGVPHTMPLPAATAGLDPGVVREAIRTVREAEAELDMNANLNLLLSATCVRIEAAVRG